MSISEKQVELKNWLEKLGMSQRKFAALYIIDRDDNWEEDAVSRFQDTFKHQMKRSTTKIETIQRYLDYLFLTDQFRDAGFVRPQSFSDDIFGAEGREAMYRISRKLTKMLKEDEGNTSSEA